MNTQNELVDEIKTELESIEADFWRLRKLVKNLMDQKRSFRQKPDQFQIKYFRREDLS